MTNLKSRTWWKRSFIPQQRVGQRCAAGLRLERLEDRSVPSVTIAPTNNGGNGYAGLHFSQTQGYTPPDTCGAAGPTTYVETVNQTLALFNPKATGAGSMTATFSTFLYTTGGLPHADSGSGFSDPIVVYDDQIGRFIVGDQDVDFNTHVSRFDIAVSLSNSPTTLGTSDWKFYSIVTTESGFDADYPGNFGYNHDAFVFTLNMFGVFGGGHCQIVSINNADLANAVASPQIFHNDLNDFSDRPTVMHDSVAGDPMWLITEHGDNASIDVIKMSNVLSSSATFSYTNLGVTAYSSAVHPLNPNGTVITTNMDSRIQKAAEWNHRIVATHSVAASSTQDVAQWYEIDVSSGTPLLMDQGRVGAGNNTYVIFPSIEINSSYQIGMTYMKSGNDASNDYMSMYLTGRDPSDIAGTMETSVLVPAGKGVTNYKDFSSGGRAGDLSGINVDPVDGSFWAANEFANTDGVANWGTAIANFTISSPVPSTDMAVTASGPSLVTAGTDATYTITITNNGPNPALGAVLSDLMPTGSVYGTMTQTAGTDAFNLGQSGSNVSETATGTIAAGSSDTFSLVVHAPASLADGAAFNDTATVSANNPDPNKSNNTATVTGTISNPNPNSDVSVSVSGPSSGNEGDTVTYNITVTNAGPANATGVVLTDTLGSILSYISATSSQGTFSQSGSVVTFTMGSIAAGSSATASVTAQAIEDGSTSDVASVTSTSPDPNTGNNSASATTSFAEPSINVSGSIRTRSRTLTNFQTATFTHASGVEPTSAFSATINWGDGTTSAGTISLSGTTYIVRGSHTYSSTIRHTITTTVVETGASALSEGGNKIAADDGGHSWRMQDVVQLPGNSGQRLNSSATQGASSPQAPQSGAGGVGPLLGVSTTDPASISIDIGIGHSGRGSGLDPFADAWFTDTGLSWFDN